MNIEAKLARQIEELRQENAEVYSTLDRMRDILTRTAIALKGPEPEDGYHDWSDLPLRADHLIDMLRSVEWVRQSAGNKYACPFCHGISERDDGPGHTETCEWVKATDPRA